MTLSRSTPRALQVALVLSALFQCCAGAQQNLILNGSFENYSGSACTNIGRAILPWTITPTCGIDIMVPQNGTCCWETPVDGVSSISLNWYAPATISQTIPTVAGAPYQVRFWMAAEPFGGPTLRTMDVLWNGCVIGSPVFVYSSQGPADPGWIEFVYSVTGTGQDTLAFSSTTAANYGPALDMISVTSPVEGLRNYSPTGGSFSCSGTEFMWATSSPRIGTQPFEVTCTHAPPSSSGICLLSTAPWSGTAYNSGIRFLVDPAASWQIPMFSDGNGVGHVFLGIPALPTLVGTHFYLQSLWNWGTACSPAPSPYGISSSNGLDVEILP